MSEEEEVPPPKRSKVEGEKKEGKAGIIYLSTVPPGMNVKRIREHFEQFGPIHRSFLQPESKTLPQATVAQGSGWTGHM
jgi:RNA recognition motif-containing protein